MKKAKNKKPLVDRAVATIRKPRGNDVQKTAVTNAISVGMQNSPSWGAATDVQAAVKVWKKDADGIEANAKLIAALREQLKTAEAKQNSLRRDWQASTKQVVSTVTVFCGGSADMVKTFNLDVVSRTVLDAQTAPGGLTVNPGAGSGEVASKWVKGTARHGFLVQHATDPADAATLSIPRASTKATFTLGGMAPHANVSMRVAAIDPASPTGQSPWSEWVVGNAR